jgi:predicted nucleic acid-binding protein
LPDEISPYAEAVLQALEHGVLHAPEIWPREVANGLVLAVRRGRITGEQKASFISAMQRVTIEIPCSASLSAIAQAIAAAERFGLTAYDAAYVDLAFRTGFPLATLDTQMRAAATRAGIAIFEP